MSIPPSRVVLSSHDLLPFISRFQHGLYEDLLPFLPFQRRNSDRRQRKSHPTDVAAALGPWHDRYGFSHVDRLFDAFPDAISLIFVYGIVAGDTAIVTVPELVPFLPLTTTRSADFIHAAIVSQNPRGAMECLNCLSLYYVDVFVGIGHAVSAGSLDLAHFLAEKLQLFQQNNEPRLAITSIQRSQLRENLEQIFQSKQFDGLVWLLQQWGQYLPRLWSARCRQECRYLALDYHLWDVLEMLSRELDVNLTEKSDEDVTYAIKTSSWEAFTYCVKQPSFRCKLNYLMDATKAWRADKPSSSLILKQIVAMYFEIMRWSEIRRRDVEFCINEALKRRALGAMQILWATNVIPYTQDEYTVPEPQSIEEFEALELLYGIELLAVGPNVTPRQRHAYLQAARDAALATDSNGNLLYTLPVQIQAVHRPGDPPKYQVVGSTGI
ncbi:unnamed protein product [Aphanomyces euteiches]|uniref:Uncharacterized protein n=1 Tax=Aphanomyces euteiches TaxID=100861 RepID=A0A6G0WH33_9STRA|nr:hypothetical protein Ae201684_015277 [Aphanomyces euteiches]KAH9072054.1 hypothetical protein Ae201684P_021191 [Aphanomyces euteiches]KAH9143721.1 hypothetical protein AeRB84_012301 [Aphanomyces euteiches]